MRSRLRSARVKLKMVDAVKSKCWMRTSALLAYLSRDLPIPLILVSNEKWDEQVFRTGERLFP
jgi:hypothetical protein